MSPFDFLDGIMYTRRIMPPRQSLQKVPGRGRWSGIGTSCHLLSVLAMGGCIRFSSEVAADAAYDAPIDVSGDIISEAEAGRTADPRPPSTTAARRTPSTSRPWPTLPRTATDRQGRQTPRPTSRPSASGSTQPSPKPSPARWCRRSSRTARSEVHSYRYHPSDSSTSKSVSRPRWRRSSDACTPTVRGSSTQPTTRRDSFAAT